MINPGSFIASHMSKIFLAMRGNPPPLNPPNRREHIPFWQPPDVSFGWGPRGKSGRFFNSISQTKTSVGGLNKAFSAFETTKMGVKKALKGVYFA
jgi:hypothetical protein